MDRNIGIDLLRIFGMLGIIGLHVLNNGGINANLPIDSFTYYLISFFRSLCYTSVDIFAIVTGYLYCQRDKISYRRIRVLWHTVFFYAIIITGLTLLYRRDLLPDTVSVIRSVFPSIEGRYWYITCYTLLFLLIPYINHLISKLGKNEYKKLLLILFITLSLFTTFGFYDYFRINRGYSTSWLVFCYLLGGYLRGNENKGNTLYYLIILPILIGLAGLSGKLYLVSSDFAKHYLGGKDWLVEYTSPFIVIASVIIVILFLRIRKTVCDRIIISLSGATFSIYIIHSHPVIYDFYLKNAFVEIAKKAPMESLLLTISVIFSIFILCYLIDIIRRFFIRILSCKR